MKRVLIGVALAATVTAALPASAASATEPYDGFGGRIVCFTAAGGRTVSIGVGPSSPVPSSPAAAGVAESDPCMFVLAEGRVGTRVRHWDSVAGSGEIQTDPHDLARRIARVQIDRVVLGTQYGVVSTSGVRNSGAVAPALVRQQGPGALWDRRCSTSYHVAVYWSARLATGQLQTGKVLGPWFKSPTCS